ncbi:MAG: efflux RND transporter periplasmic adaptor subunit [Lachnospirales bacterium]
MKEKFKLLPTAIAITLILTSCSKSTDTAEEVILTPVEVSIVEKGEVSTNLTYTGQAKAIETFQVVPKLTAKVQDTYKVVGDKVVKEDTLFTLDEKDLRNQINQLEAQVNVATTAVSSAQASYETIEGGQYQSQLLQLEAGITATEKQLENAEITLNTAKDTFTLMETNYNNSKTLLSQGIVSQNDFDQLEVQYQQAKAGVDQAQIAYDTTSNSLAQQKETYEITVNQTINDTKTTAKQSIEQAKASANSAQVQLDIVKQSLNDLTVTAPISGIISTKNVSSGEYASPSVPAYTITNMDTILVQVNVSEQLINNIHVNDKVNVSFNSLKENIEGTVYEVSPVADQTNTFPIKISIENPSHQIKPGMFADITFLLEKADDTIVIPRNTVLNSESGYYVFVVEDDAAISKSVKLGVDNGEYVEIVEGISLNDTLITTGQDYVHNNEKVNIVNSDTKEE